MARRTTAALLLAAIPLAGCSTVHPPRFDVVGVSPAKPTDEGVVLTFTLDAVNDNDKPMPLRTASYTLTLGGSTVFQGQRSPEATIPAFGSQRFELPAVIPYTYDVPTGTAAYTITGTVSYLEPGRLKEILFDSEVRVPEAPLAVGGTIDFGGG